ncbi:hypothetical protein B0J17DRAFT_677966 [Rhizoctonia solani]|nr:hypothetical protein B0J17DRAFT_677966 [Rhizoctonia solani]
MTIMSSPMSIESQLHSHNDLFNATKYNNDVLDAIKQHKANNTAAFQLGHVLLWNDYPTLLQVLIKTFLKDSQIDMKACSDHLYQHPLLSKALNDAYVCQEFAELLLNPEMPPEVVEHAPAPGSGMTPSSSHNSIQSVFAAPYLGNAAKLFIETLNNERKEYFGKSAAFRPYNWSISVIQSSGMGKSRMVDEASNTVFTLPMNIREEMPVDKLTYPPPDSHVRQYFDGYQEKGDEQQQVAYMIFLQVLFTKTKILVKKLFPNLTGSELAQAWAEYLRQGQTQREVGENRQNFYQEVVGEANKIAAINTQTMDNMERLMLSSCNALLSLVSSKKLGNKNACFLYFDEAHSLTDAVGKHKRSAFHNLGTVLSKLTSCRIFFIFLSTNSRLEGFAPPPSHYPSERVTHGSQLIPPFTELPFDIYEDKVLDSLGPLTLEKMCTTDAMVGFGRPLWFAQHQIKPDQSFYEYVQDKLTANEAPGYANDSVLAAIAVRVGITFDGKKSCSTQSRLVESHLRVAYSVPQNRAFMHTGAPSEPVVAEAAGRYLNEGERKGIPSLGPEVISVLLESGLLARGERGELAGRILVTSAHDIALGSMNGEDEPSSDQPFYHRPIPVLDFLCALFQSGHHDTIREARCLSRRGDVKRLGEVFTNSYVSFSHFTLAEDSEMLSARALATALVRGMAIQAKDGQRSIDAVIPIHMGSLDAPISPLTTSAINLQFKNRKVASEFHVDRTITVPNEEMPTISIVFEFAATGKAPDTVKISELTHRITRASNGRSHPHDHHYEIVARGCSPEVYRAISEDMKVHYEVLLGAGTMLEDFPRRERQSNKEALLAMKPTFSGERQEEQYSKRFNS